MFDQNRLSLSALHGNQSERRARLMALQKSGPSGTKIADAVKDDDPLIQLRLCQGDPTRVPVFGASYFWSCQTAGAKVLDRSSQPSATLVNVRAVPLKDQTYVPFCCPEPLHAHGPLTSVSVTWPCSTE